MPFTQQDSIQADPHKFARDLHDKIASITKATEFTDLSETKFRNLVADVSSKLASWRTKDELLEVTGRVNRLVNFGNAFKEISSVASGKSNSDVLPADQGKYSKLGQEYLVTLLGAAEKGNWDGYWSTYLEFRRDSGALCAARERGQESRASVFDHYNQSDGKK